MKTRRTRTLAGGRTVALNLNNGLRKRCGCPRRSWPTCEHSWFFSFMWQGQAHRFPVDKQEGKHVADRHEAKSLAGQWQREIREGRFVSYKERRSTSPMQPTTPADLSFETFAQKWSTAARGHVTPAQQANDQSVIRQLCKREIAGQRVGDRPIGLFTVDDWEGVLSSLKRAASTSNKYRQAVLAMQEWGVEKGYLARPWLAGKVLKRRGSVRRQKEHDRDRRLLPDGVDAAGMVTHPGEESRLLAVTGPWLYNLIVAALETCCRQGELLSLQWRDVSLPRRELTLRAANTKTDSTRKVPISPRLLAVLLLIQNDPDGNPHPASAFVFGNTVGEQAPFKKKAWSTAVLKMAGHTPQWAKGGKLSAESRAHLTAIDLHFHDLRREAGSRLLERGWKLHAVSKLLGHTNIKTTSIYLKVDAQDLQESMQQYGTGARTWRSTETSGGLHDLAQPPASDPQPLGNDDLSSVQKPLIN